ncbi:MAG: hypothetical protein ACE5F1_06110 [Planctomycetota bacterium]
MKWYAEDEPRIRALLTEQWTSKLGEEAYLSYQRVLGKFSSTVVIQALEKIGDEWESEIGKDKRPRPAYVAKACRGILGLSRRVKGEPRINCAWCDDAKTYEALAYRVDEAELCGKDIHPLAVRTVWNTSWRIVRPDWAKAAGFRPTEVTLFCHHCLSQLVGRMGDISVADWDRKYTREFIEFAAPFLEAKEKFYRDVLEETPPQENRNYMSLEELVRRKREEDPDALKDTAIGYLKTTFKE